MLVRVWEYDVPESSTDDFERPYGADGLWAQRFSAPDASLRIDALGARLTRSEREIVATDVG